MATRGEEGATLLLRVGTLLLAEGGGGTENVPAREETLSPVPDSLSRRGTERVEDDSVPGERLLSRGGTRGIVLFPLGATRGILMGVVRGRTSSGFSGCSSVTSGKGVVPFSISFFLPVHVLAC